MALSFSKRLVKEFQRGGKKTLVLYGLFAVGLCIWIPMLWKKVFRASNSAAARSGSSTSEAPKIARVSSREPALVATAAPADWKHTLRRVEQSQLVQPLVLDELVRDPFERDWIRDKKKPIATRPEPESADSDPNHFLVLSATLAGTSGGAAIISDRVYRVGQEVPPAGAIRFVLKDIRADRVVLERAGNLFELRLQEVDRPAGNSADQAP